MAEPKVARSLKLVRGEIDASETTTKLLFPTRDQGPWLPFERFADTMTTSSTKIPRHAHQAEEAIIYVLEGEIHHIDDSGRHESMTPGSTAVLTAHEQVFHELVSVPGKRTRWLSLVVRIPWHTEPPPTSLQIKGPPEPVEPSDGTLQRPVIGPLARADAFSGLELLDVELSKEDSAFVRLGNDRRAVAYALNGSGQVEHTLLGSGMGCLLEHAVGIEIEGKPGYHVALATVPIMTELEGPELRQESGPDEIRERERPRPARRRVK